MVQTLTIVWQGASGTPYTYDLVPIGSALPAVEGNYVVCRRNGNDRYSAIYAGETGDLSERLADHNKADCFKRHRATHVSYRVNYAGVDARRAEEKDIIGKYAPPCNG